MRRLIACASVFVLLSSFALTSAAQDPAGTGTSGGASTPNDTRVPSSLSMKLYRFALSTSPTCSDLKIYDVEKPDFVDFTTNPELGSAAVPPGTYPCVAFELDQVVKGTPMQTHNTCIAGQEVVDDLCDEFAKAASLPPDPNPRPGSFDGIQPFGASAPWMTCKPGGDHLTIYLTTQITQTGSSNGGRPPQSADDTTHGYPLGAPLVVGEHTTGTLVVTSNVEADSTRCIVGSPTFTFESAN